MCSSALAGEAIDLVATGSHGRTLCHEVDLTRPTAIFFGSEGHGLPETIRRAATASISIPMQHGVESLSVSVAAGVVLFEAARQRSAS